MCLNNEQVINEIEEEIKKYLETNEHTATQNLWDTAKAVLREKFIELQAYLNVLKISSKQPKSTPNRTRGTTTKKAQSKQKEENNHDQSRIT